MADYMKNVGNANSELSVEERNLLSVAYKSLRDAWEDFFWLVLVSPKP